MSLRIYHNPRCSKSRETLKLLQALGHQPTVVEYLKETPTTDELDRILQKLAMEPQQLVRFKEDEAKALGLSPQDQRSRQQWLALMVAHPRLIERPIVVHGDKAALGRPPEVVLDIL